MKIIDAIRENFEAMRAAGLDADEDDFYSSDLETFASLEILSRESRKGKKGRVFTVFHTAQGDVGFVPWPSQRLFWYEKRGKK